MSLLAPAILDRAGMSLFTFNNSLRHGVIYGNLSDCWKLGGMNIRVTVQNAANHGLSRDEVEAMLQHVPKSWSRNVDSVVLYSHQEPDFRCTYYPKGKILGLFWPNGEQPERPSKAEAAEEVLLALSVIAERGSLPARLSASLREEHLSAIGSVRDKCLTAMGQHAT